MTPELRKEASELLLHKRGIRVNVQLHVIEADEEVCLRSSQQVENRLFALWAVSQAAQTNQTQHFADFFRHHQLWPTLSEHEADFLCQTKPNEADRERFSHRRHAWHFLSWCAGLLSKIDLSNKPINSQETLLLFPSIDEILNNNSGDYTSAKLPKLPIQLRRKDQIMDWSDLLYRLHWAVRHASLNQKPSPGNIDGVMVREWHQAVNWMCCYDNEENWDLVSTETTA
ncbi:DUF4272 domain-containing protein [Undibacterium fentianense]|uniref:DUF4272 domain-containing protein n=1 Tax=Undibacterium fentianense TaxID=2828728 RepID=A0A941E2L6_9BURK|nr:DUF4272 domain-containing protein [Undibacterium fentianense]MBR7799856.1 DUF4272 domain-containing protein [Undibacterium fentianense]